MKQKAPQPTPAKIRHRDNAGQFARPPHRKQPQQPASIPDPSDGGALPFQPGPTERH